jgi:putative N6-adenine-specific DNA methylase
LQYSTIIVKTFLGLEHILEQELIALGAKETKIIKRAVQCNYEKELLYKINIESRFALKAIIPIETFSATTPDELYQAALQINWENYFTIHQSFAIDNSIFSKHFTHSQYASLKLKDAICDRFRKINEARPNINISEPDILFNLHIHEENITISLDSSGDSLHKRGYKQYQDIAPINEVLAAGLIQLSNWNRTDIFIDGMCGSGTIVIEATLMAMNKAPNLDRAYFCVKNWKDFDSNLWQKCMSEATSKIISPINKIIAIDNQDKVIKKAERNIFRAGLKKYIEVQKRNFLKFIPPHQKGVCIINPPYGERMNEDEDINLFYKEIGDSFKQHFTLYTCGIISSDFEALKKLGLKPSKRIELLNGKLPCKYQLYDIY